MADNTTLPAGAGGDSVRDVDRGTAKTQVVLLDVGGAASESLVAPGNPLPVSAASLPLPTGAATTAGQASIIAALGSPLQAGGAVSVSNFPATQPVSAAALPLPAGAATSALQTTINTTLGTPMQQTGGSLSVTNFPATQPVSAVTLPLPANAAQETGGNLAALVAAFPPSNFFPPPSAFFGAP